MSGTVARRFTDWWRRNSSWEIPALDNTTLPDWVQLPDETSTKDTGAVP